MFANKSVIKPTLAALTVGLVVGCAQPSSRLNTNAANNAANAMNAECSQPSCEMESAAMDAQASVRPASMNAWNAPNQNQNQNRNDNASGNDERVAKAFSSNRARRPASSTEEATIIAGDYILTATVRALPEPNRFFTKVMIEEVDGNGDARLIGSPQLVSSFGQVGQISVSGRASGMVETNDDINVQVRIPNDDGDCDVQVMVRRNGQLMTNSTIEVDRPN